MTRTIVIEKPGGPEELKLMDLPVGEPGAGEIRLRHEAVGLNYIDVYYRTGAYPLKSLPHALGMEAAGVVEAVGEGVSHLKVGDRVAYAAVTPGAYSAQRVMAAMQVCKLPDAISFETGAAMMLKGMTTAYLFERTAQLSPGDTVLFHAAAGGVGLIACQWAKSNGVTLIGTAGTDEKCALAKAHGAAHVINYRTEDFVARVKEITGGKGVKVAMDSVGKDTFDRSLDCIQPFGLMANFGNASGAAAPLDLGKLGRKGSLYATRPTLFTHIGTRELCQDLADKLFAKVASGEVTIPIKHRYPLERVAEAHRALEARETTGATVFTL